MPAERPSPRSMRRARVQGQTRAPQALASTQPGRLRDSCGTPTLPGTASCGVPKGPLPSSTIRTRALVQCPVEPSGTARVRVLTPSTRPEQSPYSRPTIAADVTGTCVLLTAPSPRSTLRTPAQYLFPKAPSLQISLQWVSTRQA